MVVFVIVFAVYKFDSANRAEKSMLEVAEKLVDSICDKDFDKIKMHIKNTEGAELSDDEIYNFLLNTDFYRLTFYVDDECNPVYETKVNYLNSHKGYVIFCFSALDGDLVTNTLEYVNTV